MAMHRSHVTHFSVGGGVTINATGTVLGPWGACVGKYVRWRISLAASVQAQKFVVSAKQQQLGQSSGQWKRSERQREKKYGRKTTFTVIRNQSERVPSSASKHSSMCHIHLQEAKVPLREEHGKTTAKTKHPGSADLLAKQV